MEQFKRAQVIMLPTKDITKLRTYCGSQLHISHSTFKEPYYQDQHLYIISDDEIKEGDWCYDVLQKKPYKIHDVAPKYPTINRYFKKIIATTDTSLNNGIQNGKIYNSNFIGTKYEPLIIPQPSQQFIIKYIEEYNKGNIITDVLIEYEYRGKEYVDDQDAYGYDKQVLKINPKDNTITIKKLKDNWNREEVEKLMLIAYSNASGYVQCLNNNEKQRFLSFSEVIKENL